MIMIELSPYTLMLQILGVVIRIKCKEASTYQEIQDNFSAHVILESLYETPEIDLFFEGQGFDRYFYRERPLKYDGVPLNNVYVRMFGEIDYEPWTSCLPPLIPFGYKSIKGRFVALHAGCVYFPNGRCFLFPGSSGAGKTTIARLLCQEYDAGLLTDEASFLHRRTPIVEPLAMSMGIRPDTNTPKKAVPAISLCSRIENTPRSVTTLLFTTPSASKNRIRVVSAQDSFRLLMENLIDVGTNQDEIILTLSRLAKHCDSYQMEWRNYNDIKRLITDFLP